MREPRLQFVRSTAAIARLTVFEAMRSRFLPAVLLLGLGAMAWLAQGVAVTDELRARLLRHSMSQTVFWITLVCTLFLAAFALPADVESRRVHTLLAKPVSRGAVFAGRLAGFATLAALIVLALGIIAHVVFGLAMANASASATQQRAPDGVITWGANPGRTSVRNQPALILDDPHDAGMTARFTRLDPANFGSDGLDLQLRFSLQLRRDRSLRAEEFATLEIGAPGAARRDVLIRQVRLREREPGLIRIPWQLTGAIAGDGERPVTPGDARLRAVEVTITTRESPWHVVIEPDSIVLLQRPSDPLSPWLGVLAAHWAQIVFVLAAVALFSAAFTPFTALLGGGFAGIMAWSAGSVRALLDDWGRTIAHARRLEAHAGLPVEPTMQFGALILGDADSPSWLTRVLIALGDVFPDFARFGIDSGYIAGHAPAVGDVIGVVWLFGAWTVGLALAGMLVFTLREVP